jgi:hypothetical protein
MERVDCVVVGAGVVGLAIARAMALGGREVLVLEAEGAIGTGTSSRNSEVIHAGLYYPRGSLKARLCVQGRDLLYAYCASHSVAHRRCGKLLVATTEPGINGNGKDNSGTGALVVDVQQTLGSGTLAAWTISLGALISSTLPSQTGNSGKFLTTNGTSASWGVSLIPTANLSDVSSAATARTNLGLTIGVQVQAYDAGLQSIAGLTTAADRLIYTTALDTYAVTTFTADARTLVGAANFAAMRTSLGLVIGTNVQAYNANLAAMAGLTLAANKLPYATGSGAMAVTDLSSFARTLLDDADAGAMRTTIGAASSGANSDITSLGSLTAGAMQAILAGGVIGSLAQSGYVNVGGFLFQWGRYAGGSSSPTISFPLAFPVECFVVVPAAVGFSADANLVSSSSVHHVALRGSPTTSSFQAWCSFENEGSDVFAASTNTAFHWIAVGY